MASRFVSRSKQCVEQFLQSEQNKSNMYKTKQGVALLSEYLEMTGEARDIHQIQINLCQLNDILSMFILSVKKEKRSGIRTGHN